MHKRDSIFCTICKAGAFVSLLLVVGIFAQLLIHSADAWKHFGISFLWGIDWDPAMDIIILAADIFIVSLLFPLG